MIIILLLGVLNIKTCQDSSNIINADLTFRSVSFKSAYGASDKDYSDLLNEMDSVLNTNNKNETYKLYQHFNNLKNENLLRNPYIFLKIKKDSVITVYLSEEEYQKVKNFKHVDLYKKNKKVSLQIKLSQLDNDIFYSDDIIKVNKIKGKSRSNL
jgi:hypothetical protein